MINRVTRDRIEERIAEYRTLASGSAAALEQIALAEVAESVQQSNAIEGSTLGLDDTERILDGRLPRGTHELREVLEATNLARVTADRLGRTAPLTVESILRWHGMLLTGIRDDAGGRFRRSGEWVRVGSHLGANPEFVPDLVSDALAQYRADGSASFLDRIARFHCEFEIVHPFVDGNGRIGRVLIDAQLQGLGLPPVIVRARNRRADYYPVLAEYSRTGSHAGMTGLLALLLQESLHKRIALLRSRRIVPLAQWARDAGVRGTVAANKAKRQTLPALRIRDRWMIADEH